MEQRAESKFQIADLGCGIPVTFHYFTYTPLASRYVDSPLQ